VAIARAAPAQTRRAARPAEGGLWSGLDARLGSPRAPSISAPCVARFAHAGPPHGRSPTPSRRDLQESEAHKRSRDGWPLLALGAVVRWRSASGPTVRGPRGAAPEGGTTTVTPQTWLRSWEVRGRAGVGTGAAGGGTRGWGATPERPPPATPPRPQTPPQGPGVSGGRGRAPGPGQARPGGVRASRGGRRRVSAWSTARHITDRHVPLAER